VPMNSASERRHVSAMGGSGPIAGVPGSRIGAGAYTDSRTAAKLLRCLFSGKGVKVPEVLSSVRLRGSARRLFLAGAALACLGLLAVASAAGSGSSLRPLAAAIDITQTCSQRVPPNTRIDVGATLTNPGTENLTVLPNAVTGDAGTEPTSDDFILTRTGGDDGDGLLNPGENWTYTGSYTAGTEDMTDNVSVDAVGVPSGTELSDIAPCVTDVIQQPAPGEIVGVRVVRGKILVKKPGDIKFIELHGPTEIPVGSQVDTLHGTIALIAGLGGGRTNTAEFYAGLFTLIQAKATNAYMILRLDGGNFRGCGRKSQSLAITGADRSKRPVRRVWGSGKGRFTTRGRYSSATVRGTRWLTQDQCNGTLTRVLRGIVLVRNFRQHKNVSVRAGHSYLAPAP
jgi:hypothetical protein